MTAATTTTATTGSTDSILTGADTGPLLLPEEPKRFGPTTRRLLGRFIVLLAIVEIVGTVLVFATDSVTWRAFGLGLVYPGGGLLYTASPVLFLLTQVLVLIALVLWWGLSTHFSIPLVWFVAAMVAALLADGPRLWVDRGTVWEWAIPVAYLSRDRRRRHDARQDRAPVPSQASEDAPTSTPTSPRRSCRSGSRRFDRPTPWTSELLRWCYSFADQPDDGLAGLDWGEQFHGGTQLRYQLNSVSWAMSLYAANYLPNAPTADDGGAGQGGATSTPICGCGATGAR